MTRWIEIEREIYYELLSNAHLEYLAEEGVLPPVAKGIIWCYVDVDTSAFLGKTEKATATKHLSGF